MQVLGTDHGAAAPLMLFGKHAKKGILGNSPGIPADIQVVNNIPFQYDFRSVYASVLEQWFCVTQPALNTMLLQNYQSFLLYRAALVVCPKILMIPITHPINLFLKCGPTPIPSTPLFNFLPPVVIR